MAAADSPTTPAAAGSPGRRRRLLPWLLGLLALLLALVVVTGAGVWWGLRHERGTAWLLSRLPGVDVVNPHGTLLGDFGADSVVWRFGDGGELRLTKVAWQGLGVYRPRAETAWALVWFDRLQAEQARLAMPRPTQTNRSPPPRELRLPVELVVQALRIDELHGGPLGTEPLRGLNARIHLGDDGGRLHRIESLAGAHSTPWCPTSWSTSGNRRSRTGPRGMRTCSSRVRWPRRSSPASCRRIPRPGRSPRSA
jgi:translocation and assembly module TamB